MARAADEPFARENIGDVTQVLFGELTKLVGNGRRGLSQRGRDAMLGAEPAALHQ